MKRHIGLILAVLIWLGTFALVVPARVQFPKAFTIAGGLCVMYAPMSWLSKPELYVVAENSFWIGMLIMLGASGAVILAAGRGKRAAYIVALVDLVVIAVSLFIGYLLG